MKYIIEHWPQISVLIALVTGCFGYLVKIFLSNRDKRRHNRYEIFQQEKLKAYVSFNNSYIEMSFKIVTAINIYDIVSFQNEINKLKEPSDDLFKRTITLSSYLNSKTYKNYKLLYGSLIEILTDISRFNSFIMDESIRPSTDKYTMIRLHNYVLKATEKAMETFEEVQKKFQNFYRE
jgi:hypothetical protein